MEFSFLISLLARDANSLWVDSMLKVILLTFGTTGVHRTVFFSRRRVDQWCSRGYEQANSHDCLADFSRVLSILSLSRSYFIHFHEIMHNSTALTLGPLQSAGEIFLREAARGFALGPCYSRISFATNLASQACTVFCVSFYGRHCSAHANAALNASRNNDEKRPVEEISIPKNP